jgi:hypothetical protein
MALFMDIHDLGSRDPESFLDGWSTDKSRDITCLRHWVNADGRIALLVEAPDRESLQTQDRDALEVTELLAPASRWIEADTVETSDFDLVG